MSRSTFSRRVKKTFSTIVAILYFNSLLAPAAGASKISVDELLGNDAPDIKAQTQNPVSSKPSKAFKSFQSRGNSRSPEDRAAIIHLDTQQSSDRSGAEGLAVSMAGSAGMPAERASGTQSSMNQFQFDPVSGAGVISLPIETPPGRQNLKPSLALTYSPRGGNKHYGAGWGVSFGYIARSIKDRVPVYDDDVDEFVAVVEGKRMELVEISEGRYRARIGALTYDFEFDGYQWIMRNGNGLTYYFGQDYLYGDQSRRRYGRPGPPFWHLSKVMDKKGNYYVIRHLFNGEFEIYWSGEPGTADDGMNTASQNFYARVEAIFDVRDDIMVDWRYGCRDGITRRIKEINIYALGELQRRYALSYDYSQRTGRSLLRQIAQYGADGISTMPVMQFSYAEAPVDYSLIRQQDDLQEGDNLWSFRYSSFDRGHDNPGPVPPYAMAPFGGAIVQSTWSGAGQWSQDQDGRITLNGIADVGYYFYTYLYTTRPVSIPIHYSAHDWNPGFYLNGDYSRSLVSSMDLVAGYNLLEYTDYNQHQNFYARFLETIADKVDLMNSVQLVLPQMAGDFNGDGLTDVATFYPASGKVKVELSSGAAFLPKTTWLQGIDQDSLILIGDLNADARTDLVVFDTDRGSWEPAFSDGAQFVRQPQWLSGFGVNERVLLADVNVDGKADAVRIFVADNAKKIQVALNRDDCFETDPAVLLIGDHASHQVITGDINGDGMVDFGSFDPATGNWRIINNKRGTPDSLDREGADYLLAFNLGTGKTPLALDFNNDGVTDCGYYDPEAGTITYIVSHGAIMDRTRRTMPFAFNLKKAGLQLQSGDFNGDGLIDFIAFDSGGQIEFAYSNGIMSDLLIEINNGIGGLTTIEYTPSTAFPHVFLPFVMPLVSAVTVSNSRNYTVRTRYDYEGGLWNASDREFYGFQKVRIYDADDNYTETEFYQTDLALRGIPKSTQFVNAEGAVLGRTVYDWQAGAVSGETPEIRFARLDRTDQFEYDTHFGARRSAVEYFYEQSPSFGYPDMVIQYGEVDADTGNDTGDDKNFVRIQYVNNFDPDVWLVGLPAVISHFHAGIWTPYLEESFSYDNGSVYQTPLEGLKTGETRKAYFPQSQTLSRNFSYDDYGNPTGTTDFNGNSSDVFYDAQFHLFPVRMRNALAQEATAEYYGVGGVSMGDFSSGAHSGLFGQKKSVTDINQTQEFYRYDAFGRLAQVHGPRDTMERPALVNHYAYFDDYIRTISEKRLEHGTERTLRAVTFTDGLGRVIQMKSPSGQDGVSIISGEAEYDHRGMVLRKYNPRSTSLPPEILEDVIPPDLAAVSYEYDEMGRPLTVTNPDSTFITQQYDVGQRVEIDANGHQQISYSDVRGNIIKREEYTGADGRCARYARAPYMLYASTDYIYDYNNRLVRTIDAHGNATEIFYDGFGRKIAMDDPDMGHWEYGYDANGNMIRQTDAEGRQLDFSYDALNRLVQKTDYEEIDVRYHYDLNPESNGIGRLGLVEYGQIEGNDMTRFFYDEFGRETRSVKTIDGISYDVSREYDAMNHLRRIRYPDGSNVSYYYDDAGRLGGVFGDEAEYVTDIDYNVMGQVQRVSFGTGTVKQYFYDDRTFRLQRIYAINNQGEVIQDLNYRYDALGNIIAVEDFVDSATQEFRYDHLSRLVEASAPETYGTRMYVYDELGNILEKDGRIYIYGENGAGPHAVTSFSDESGFGYDANGNMITHHSSRGDFTYRFDAENHLRSVDQGGRERAAFGYDGDGGRVKKVVSDALEGVPASQMAYPELLEGGSGEQDLVTHFVGRLYERDNLHEIKHIYLGNDRIVSVRDGAAQYVHTDHLGSTHVVEDETGNPTNWNQYKPFGEFSRRVSLQEEDQKSGLYFTQQMLDDETGLYYYGVRYYDPMLGRFISADPTVMHPDDAQNLNRFAYVRNNPINLTDPTGYDWWSSLRDSVSGFLDDSVDWLEKVTGAEWSVDIEVGYSQPYQDFQTVGQTTGDVGYTLMTQPWQAGIGIYRWAFLDPRYRILETTYDPWKDGLFESYINDGDSVFVNGILNSEEYAIQNANKVHATKVAYNPTDGVLADLVEAFFQKLTFTSAFDRRLARDLSGHKRITLSGHSQGGIIIGNTLLNLGLRNQRNAVKKSVFINTQISVPRSYLSSVVGGVNAQHVAYRSRYFDFSNSLAPNITEPFKFLSGVTGLLYLPLGMSHHGIH